MVQEYRFKNHVFPIERTLCVLPSEFNEIRISFGLSCGQDRVEVKRELVTSPGLEQSGRGYLGTSGTYKDCKFDS